MKEVKKTAQKHISGIDVIARDKKVHRSLFNQKRKETKRVNIYFFKQKHCF